MKKIILTMLSLVMMFCDMPNAYAIDFKAKGEWIMSFDYGVGSLGASSTNSGGNVYGFGTNSGRDTGPDNFNANQRIRLQLDAIASENLSGTVFFEMGESKWGYAQNGAALGADQTIVELKHAYIDWIIPSTELKIRMGIQGIALPSYTTVGSMVLNNDAAGIVVSNKFNDTASLTMFWMRPYNDNYTNESTENELFIGDLDNYLDNVDIFGFALPLSFDGFNIIPWATYMAVGKNFARHSNAMGNSITTVAYGLLPADWNGMTAINGASSFLNNNLNSYGNVIHAGLTGEITATDPLRITWDFNYGFADFGTFKSPMSLQDYEVKREGFYASLLLEYKMNFATPGLYAWYSSGDDGDAFNGSERMPTISNVNAHNDFSHYAGTGNSSIGRENILGPTLVGTWGIGLRLKDFSFVEDLKHTLSVNYFSGTNHPNMAKYVSVENLTAQGNVNFSDMGYFRGAGNGFYLTTADSAFEFGLTTDYQIYENLKLYVEAAYLMLDFDQSDDVWGDDFTATDSWNINVNLIYTF